MFLRMEEKCRGKGRGIKEERDGREVLGSWRVVGGFLDGE